MTSFADYRYALFERLAERSGLADAQVGYSRPESMENVAVVYIDDQMPTTAEGLTFVDASRRQIREETTLVVIVNVSGSDRSQYDLDQQCQTLTREVLGTVLSFGTTPMFEDSKTTVSLDSYTGISGQGAGTGAYAARCEVTVLVNGREELTA